MTFRIDSYGGQIGRFWWENSGQGGLFLRHGQFFTSLRPGRCGWRESWPDESAGWPVRSWGQGDPVDEHWRNFTAFEPWFDRMTQDRLAARWGANQAVQALRHQWPEPITDRRPTEADADGSGMVQYSFDSVWHWAEWRQIAETEYDWLHTANWRPKPEPTEKEQALKLLERVGHELEDPEYALLYRIVQSAPDTTPCLTNP